MKKKHVKSVLKVKNIILQEIENLKQKIIQKKNIKCVIRIKELKKKFAFNQDQFEIKKLKRKKNKEQKII